MSPVPRISKLPDDDYIALLEWTKTHGHGDHADEISFGRLWMWFGKNSADKWVFNIYKVSTDDGDNDFLRLVMAMENAGYHVDANHYGGKVSKFKGKCLAGVSPANQQFDAMREFDNNLDVREYVRCVPNPFPKELVEEISWLEPRVCELEE